VCYAGWSAAIAAGDGSGDLVLILALISHRTGSAYVLCLLVARFFVFRRLGLGGSC